jgi:hypothetical protein
MKNKLFMLFLIIEPVLYFKATFVYNSSFSLSFLVILNFVINPLFLLFATLLFLKGDVK